MATKKNTKKVAPKKKVVAKKPVKKAPAKKVAAKKPVKKTPAKKIVAKKPVKKAPAKKVVAKKPVKKAPAKKVVAKKPVKKVPAKKVVAKKPVKKAPVKKVVAKKPVKKAPAKKVVANKPEKVVAKKAPVVKAKKETIKVEKPVAKKVEKAPKAEKPAKVEKPAKEEKKPEMRMASKPNTPKKVTRGEKNSPFYKQPDIKALASINPAFKIHNARPNIIKPAVPKVQDTRSRYSDAELQEFKEIILRKLEEARKDLEMLRGSLSHTDDHGTDDTSPTFKMMEDGSETLSREETAQLAGRQEKFIMALDNALIRIENKTYGVCRVTGLLIGKERLKLVPHTTLSIEAKNMQD